MWLDTLAKWKSGCCVVFARGITLPSGTWCRTVGPVVLCQNTRSVEILLCWYNDTSEFGHGSCSLSYSRLRETSHIIP
jgi:hypothetical protein